MENPNDFYYVSAPTSPTRWNLQENMDFYSVPTSPLTRGISSNALFGFETEPPSLRTYEDANFTLDDFEFETSCRFDAKDMILIQDFKKSVFDHQEHEQEQQFRQREDSLPSANMAFADELFCNGKVLPLTPPLKLPPHLQHDGSKSGNHRSTFSSSPCSPSLVLRFRFSPRRMRNYDFDPFTVALENVREEKRGKAQGKNYRRTRSLSPFRAPKPQIRSTDLVDLNNQNDNYWGHPIAVDEVSPIPNGQRVKQVEGSPINVADPKGLSFARKVRLVKLGKELPSKINFTTSSESDIVEAEETAKESGVRSFSTGESKRQKIKNFLFMSASTSKAIDVKNREQNAAAAASSWKLAFWRKLSFKPAASNQDNGGDRTLAKAPKMTEIPYKPRLLMCMGFGANYVQ